ncbi:Chaperone protein dnaJ 72 [Quillaja saponaria]|uniref:Chaperone protein dnaJ 72 n=1 Tax=Quillaja saponaria TaxID=32244 RepID=A0AAD7VDP1_QUISA|nr:Chaperone protein dnaJ 72 [Quillaja saponaria]
MQTYPFGIAVRELRRRSKPRAIKENATLRFKWVSEAYEVLSDDRADYNIRLRAGGSRSGFSTGSDEGYGCSYYQSNYNFGGNGNTYKSKPKGGSGTFDGFTAKFEVALHYLTTRAFLLNVAFAGALLGAVVIIDMGRDAIWKTHNSGKSFEEVMESVEKAENHKLKEGYL